MFRLGYNTNGLAHHRVLDALELVAELGYEALSITPDVGQLDPFRLDREEVARVRARAEELGLELTVETGARFLLDPAKKHRPNLLDDEPAARARRVELLERHVDLAADLGATVVSLWAGAASAGSVGDRRDGTRASESLWQRLCDGLKPVLVRAREQGVQLAFEPEPGMFVERPSGFEELADRLGDAGAELGLCLDVGHCHATRDLPVADVIRRYKERLVLVQLDDCKTGEHVHRMFGEGDLDLRATMDALLEIGFDGVAAVELSRDSHRGPEAAREALAKLRSAFGKR
ncbi:MAG: sugar phosphate isomerase/epimerase [Planctomycetes bacterium]|nr:sugar phosphate isomerase/epimerase [Planctomycetota bacterium]